MRRAAAPRPRRRAPAPPGGVLACRLPQLGELLARCALVAARAQPQEAPRAAGEGEGQGQGEGAAAARALAWLLRWMDTNGGREKLQREGGRAGAATAATLRFVSRSWKEE